MFSLLNFSESNSHYLLLVLGFGVVTTSIVHLLVAPYVIRFKILKNEKAKTMADISNVQSLLQQTRNEEKSSKHEKTKEETTGENTREGRGYDLSGCTLEYTNLNLFGNEVKQVTDFEGLHTAKSSFGMVNLETGDGKKLFYLEVSLKFHFRDYMHTFLFSIIENNGK